jgi:hypothetical protein
VPKLGRTPTFAEYVDTYLTTIKAGQGTKKPATIEREESTLALWKNHMGGIRLDKIRPAQGTNRWKEQAYGQTRRDRTA